MSSSFVSGDVQPQLLIQLHIPEQQLNKQLQQPQEQLLQLQSDISKRNMIINIMILTPTLSIEKMYVQIIINRIMVITMMIILIMCMEMKSLKTVTTMKNLHMKTIL